MDELEEGKKIDKREMLALLKKLWVYIREYKKLVYIILLFTMLQIIADGIYPLLWSNALTRLTESNYEQFFIALIFYVSVGHFFMEGVSVIGEYTYSRLEQNFITDIKKKMYFKLMDVNVCVFDNKGSGEIIKKVYSEPHNILNNLKQIFMTCTNLLKSGILIICSVILSPLLAICYLIALILMVILFKINGRKVKKIKRDISEIDDSAVSILNQSINGVREVKGLGIKHEVVSNFFAKIVELKKKEIKNSNIDIMYGANMNFIITLLATSVYLTTGWLVYQGKLSIPYLIAIDIYTWQIIMGFQKIRTFNQYVQSTGVSLSRIFEVLDDDVYTVEKFGDKKVEEIQGNIEIRDVSFAYDGINEVLSNVNVPVHKNKKLAIVGRSGSGKSTLFSLLLRFYDFKSGEILIDGINIKEFDEDSLRKHISVIRQEPFLFNSTIKENLTMVKSNATTEELREACKIAYIDEYIMSLPKQYDTLIGEGGVNLSGGQKQRISIARAMLKKSKIMLFDEATSALDNESQYNVKKAIDEVAKDHTVIIIAHRLSTVIDCDEMILLDAGKVVARGTHADLIKHNEVYNKLYNVDLING
ncbi:MAG: hypothetical protein A2Y24_05435 [Clostridiales bacterium GWE2_32_10]|nr:MAG: hypothetical protein A2Y24_05435 [Clostridiales bacterium GWE2_32_10]HBY21616.1 hypothetical protein [Clostridiales bacterium]